MRLFTSLLSSLRLLILLKCCKEETIIMTDPQPGVINDKDMADKTNIDAPYSAVLSSTPPSSAAAVSSVQENNGSSSVTLKKAPQSTDDKAGSAGNMKASSQNNGGVEKGSGSSSPKPKIKISLIASSSSNGGDKKSNGKSSTSSSSIKKTKDGKKSSSIKPSTLKKTSTSSSGSYSGVGCGGGHATLQSLPGQSPLRRRSPPQGQGCHPPHRITGITHDAQSSPNCQLSQRYSKSRRIETMVVQWTLFVARNCVSEGYGGGGVYGTATGGVSA